MNGMGMAWMFGALLLVGLVLLGGVLTKALSGNSPTASVLGDPPGSAARSGRGREILEERYARGELSAEEYRDMRRTLDGDDG